MTRRNVTLALASTLAATLTLFLGGCNGGSGGSGGSPTGGGPLELTFWHTQTGENKTALETLCKRFNDQNGKGITVKPLYQGDYKQLYSKLMAGITARKTPEIAVSYESMVVEYMKAGVVVPLDSYLKGPNGLSKADTDDIFPAFLQTNRYPNFNNQMLSFPFTKSLLVTYVNMDALKRAGIAQPPVTWADFKSAAARLTHPAQGALPAAKGLAIDINASTIDGWILSHGGPLTDSSGAALNGPATLATYQDVHDLVTGGYAYQTTGDTYQADFGAQRAAMVCTSSTQRILFRPLIANRFAWKLVNIPQASPAKPVTILYGANLCIFKTTPAKQDAAWEFFHWLAMKEQAAYWAIHSSYMPLRKSVSAMPEMQAAWKTDPQGKQAFDLIPYAVPEPNVRGWQEVRDQVTDAMQAVISGTKAPAAAVKDLDAAADETLRNKKM